MGMEMSSIEEMLKEGATLTLEPETVYGVLPHG